MRCAGSALLPPAVIGPRLLLQTLALLRGDRTLGYGVERCVEWNDAVHDGAVGLAAKMQSAAQLAQARGHTGNAETGRRPPILLQVGVGAETEPIIADDNVQAIAH